MNESVDSVAASTAMIPATLSAWLDPLMIALLVLALVWLLLALYGRYLRRSYKLTVMERQRSADKRPDFLKVDHEARSAALERGQDYVDSRKAPPEDEVPSDPAEALPPPPPRLSAVGWFSRLASIGAVVFAVANVVVVGIGALMRVESTHEFFYSLASWDRWKTLFENYWIGLVLAGVVIAAQLFRLVQTLRAK